MRIILDVAERLHFINDTRTGWVHGCKKERWLDIRRDEYPIAALFSFETTPRPLPDYRRRPGDRRGQDGVAR